MLARLLLVVLAGCGGGGSGSSDESSSSQLKQSADTTAAGFYAPQYGDARQDTKYEATLGDVTRTVLAYQAVGSELLNKLPVATDGLVQPYADLKVKLIAASRNDCPSGLEGCDTMDSTSLGVGSNALVVDLATLKNSIKDQGERGSCVSFALNAGMELLMARESDSQSLSEQNTYFQGKRYTDTWDSAGLSPYDTIAQFVNRQTRFVAASYWPYNKEDKQCSDYNSQYPNATCSQTEAQGGGSDTKQQDPRAAAASGYQISTAHQLYASIGRIKQALYRGYPVAIAVNANYDFQLATYRSGVVSWAIKADDCGTSLCGHEVLAVGYQDDDRVAGGGYVIIKNSWTSEWGDAGLAYVTYEWLQHSLLDAQGLVRYTSAR